MPFSSLRLSPRYLALVSLLVLLVVIPLLNRYLLGWSNPYGYGSDLGIGLLLTLLLHNRPLWLTLPVLLSWCLLQVGNAELITAVGRMPEPGDLHYLTDAQFLGNSTQGGGLGHPWLVAALTCGLLTCLWLNRRQSKAEQTTFPAYLYLLPLALLSTHSYSQYRSPGAADQWQQFNLPHKLLAEATSSVRQSAQHWLDRNEPEQRADIRALSQLDLNGQPLLNSTGQARNVLIITLEGIPGAYIAASRTALQSDYAEDPMPRLSRWAERAMTTPDYVLHGHQTIRGLYAMLCGDYNKLDSGTPKGVELLNNPQRAAQCLPAQLSTQGFSTHFLQGAGLRFMAKDKIMPQMGFNQTKGRDWFQNKAYLEFPWGMDDKAFFEGALTYVQQLREQPKPWMLTLLTVGTHQPYSAPTEYLERYPDAKRAAIAYVDDALDSFLSALEQQGVLKDTLVVITSDESHGIDKVRLASAWGFNLILAPEQAQLPKVKSGVYGHVDLTASLLDYFALPIPNTIAGRSLFRDYSQGRSIMSYTNGLLRQHDGQGHFSECDFQQVCRRYASDGFLSAHAPYLGRMDDRQAHLLNLQAEQLDQSLQTKQLDRQYQFATHEQIDLPGKFGNDWTDNLIGAQYLELPAGTHTTVNLKIHGLDLSAKGTRFILKAKEFDRDVQLPIPLLPRLKNDQPLELSFSFDNLQARKAFSFHLLAQGHGAIEITDFSVTTEALLASSHTSQ